eukprot:4359920-Pyramimonas_sp.AAC.1
MPAEQLSALSKPQGSPAGCGLDYVRMITPPEESKGMRSFPDLAVARTSISHECFNFVRVLLLDGTR